MTSPTSTSTAPLWLNIALWVAQVLLAFFFGFAGWMKLVTPIAELAGSMAWTVGAPELLIRFIGVAELLGAIGILLPALTRVLPLLTPLAALGFAVIQILAIGLHASRAEFSILPMNAVLLAASVFVVWGRMKVAPVNPRS